MNYLSKLELGNRLAQFRKAKDYSQEELASTIGISRPSLVQIESGKRNIDILEMQKFANTLGFSIDEFLTANPDQLSEPQTEYLTSPKKAQRRKPVCPRGPARQGVGRCHAQRLEGLAQRDRHPHAGPGRGGGAGQHRGLARQAGLRHLHGLLPQRGVGASCGRELGDLPALHRGRRAHRPDRADPGRQHPPACLIGYLLTATRPPVWAVFF